MEAEPTAMVLVDRRRRILFANTAAERLFRYTGKELEGQDIQILLPEVTGTAPGALHHSVFSLPISESLPSSDRHNARRKDGSEFPVKLGLNTIETRGRIWDLISVVDMTAQERAKAAALRESEARFRNLADTAPVMIWTSGQDKLCTFFNQGWLDFRGRSMAEELGNGWVEGVHPDDVQPCMSAYSGAFDSRQRFRIEYRLRRSDDEYRWILDTGVPLFAPDGAFTGYIGSCVDITEVKRAQQEAFARQKLESLGVLTSGIAHDFGNILSSIIAHTELIQEDLPLGSSTGEELSTIRNIATKGSEIIRELMIYTGQDKSVVERLDISAVVEEILALLKVSISKRVTLKTRFSSSLPTVLANASHIRQIAMNLIINASEAIGENEGVIEVSTSRVTKGTPGNVLAHLPRGDYICLEVSDTGGGMKPEVQAKIFDPFFTTKSRGRGLGLAVIDGIVRRYGGSVNVTSAAGHGSRFQVVLPVTSESIPKSRQAKTAG